MIKRTLILGLMVALEYYKQYPFSCKVVRSVKLFSGFIEVNNVHFVKHDPIARRC